jgi:ATP adenylyltransferase
VAEERLWAPWRLDYVKSDKGDGCIFCERGDYVVADGERCFVMLNAYPYTNGHVMVSPYEHIATLEELEADTLLELMTMTQRSIAAIRDAYSPEGFNIGVNQGKVAGGSVEDHFHLHVVPRWGGDTNFMPAVGGVRVLPQSLEDSYKALTASWPSRTA